MNEPRDITAAAAWLGVSASWLYKQVSARRVPHTRIARQIRFTEDHLQKILAAGEEPVLRPVSPIRQPARGLVPRRTPPPTNPPTTDPPPTGPDNPPPPAGPKKNTGRAA